MSKKKLNDDYILFMERAVKQFKKFSQREWGKRNIDVTHEQWNVLLKCYEKEGISQRAIADSTFKDPASITRMLDILERRKLVRRKADPNDRRSHDLYLTDEGKRFVEMVLPLSEEMLSYGLRNVNPTEKRVFLSVLNQLYENIA